MTGIDHTGQNQLAYAPRIVLRLADEHEAMYSCNTCPNMRSFTCLETGRGGPGGSVNVTRFCEDCTALLTGVTHAFAPEHIPGKPMHPWTCPACVLEAARRKRYRQTRNPHRPGTKVAAQWAKDRAVVDHAMDLRGETYWSS